MGIGSPTGSGFRSPKRGQQPTSATNAVWTQLAAASPVNVGTTETCTITGTNMAQTTRVIVQEGSGLAVITDFVIVNSTTITFQHTFNTAGSVTVIATDGGLNTVTAVVNVVPVSNTKIFVSGFGNSGGVPGDFFSLNLDGSGHTVLHGFAGGTDGAAPLGVVKSNSVLYGITRGDTGNQAGTLYQINPAGTGYQVLYNWPLYSQPSGNVLLGQDGNLYGVLTSEFIGPSYPSGVFSISTSGTNYAVLKNFTSQRSVEYRLVQDASGVLYGVSVTNTGLQVFKLNTDGSGFSDLHTFAINPYYYISGVTVSEGLLYGLVYTVSGWQLFSLSTSGGSPSILATVGGTSSGGLIFSSPEGLLLGADGKLYGVFSSASFPPYGSVFRINTDGSGLSIMHAFAGTDGSGPLGQLMQGLDGTLYGTTTSGGSNGYGTVFKIQPDGSGFTSLYSLNYTYNYESFPICSVLVL
jgi:uncharacterized repeat protein (TIGR03803 family)